MADVTGPRNTANVTQDIRRIEMAETILELEPNSYPLTVLASRLGTETTGNPEFFWMEDERAARFSAVNGTTGTGADVVVDDPSYFAEHAMWKNTRTGENMRVVSVTASSSTVTFVRGVGGSAVATADEDELMHIGWAQPEGDTSRPERSTNPTKVTNYTQIIRTPFGATRTWRQSANMTRPKDWDRQANKASIEHAIDWEETFFHGKPSENTSGANPRRTTGGAFHYIQSNFTHAGGAMTEAEFFGAFSAAFRYGNQQTKTLFASRLVVDVINGYPRGKLELVQADNDATYGINVTKFRSPHGDLNVIRHNLLEGDEYGGYGVILDLSLIKRKVLSSPDEGSADTHIRENIQPNDLDGRKDEVLTEQGLQFGQEKAHAIIDGVTN